MSEPDSGSDLASVRTRAVRCEGGWRLTGRKIWTTNAQHCALHDRAGALVGRAGRPAEGLVAIHRRSVAAGRRRAADRGPHRRRALLRSDFRRRIPRRRRVDRRRRRRLEAGDGRTRLRTQRPRAALFERRAARLLAARSCAATARATPTLRLLGSFATQLATLRCLSIAVTARLARGESPVVEAALVKDIGTEFEQAIPAQLEAAIGADPHADASIPSCIARWPTSARSRRPSRCAAARARSCAA